MACQLLNHAKSEDWSFRRVMQNVQAHHSRVEIAVYGRILVICFCFLHFDYERGKGRLFYLYGCEAATVTDVFLNSS